MSKPPNPSAFPLSAGDCGYADPEFGMTLRDYFAAKAMHAILTSPITERDALGNEDECAEWAYLQADAMLRKREGEE